MSGCSLVKWKTLYSCTMQVSHAVEERETFGSLANKNYIHASKAMIEALDKLEKGDTDFLPNPDSEATYNTVPTLAQAWDYRLRRIKSWGKA